METRERRDLAVLAYKYQNPIAWFRGDTLLVPQGMDTDKGKYRRTKEDAWFTRPDTTMSRTGYPNHSDVEDEWINFNLEPLGHGFYLNSLEMNNFKDYGYGSKAEMIKAKTEWKSYQMKLDREARIAAFAASTANYESANVITKTSTAKWDDHSNSDPLADVTTAKGLCKYLNYMGLSDTTLRHLQQNAKVLASSTATGAVRSKINPEVTVEYLKGYFGIPTIEVFMAEESTNSAKKGTTTRQNLWGNEVVLAHVNPDAGKNKEVPTWAKLLYLDAPGFSGTEGWIVKETRDDRAGGIGLTNYDMVYYMECHLYAKRMAVLIQAY